jgi:hypothetical protein
MMHLTGGFEPCPSYRPPIEHDEPVCASCGHLADDHESAGARVLVMTDRRGLRRVELPARRAS